MSSLLVKMVVPFALLAATGVPSDPACAASAHGSAPCGGKEVAKPKDVSAAASTDKQHVATAHGVTP